MRLPSRMHLLPLTALGIVAGVALPFPAAWGPLLLLGLAFRRTRTALVPLLAALAGSLLPAGPAPAPLVRVLPDGAPLVQAEGRVARGPDLPIAGRSRLLMDVERMGERPVRGRVRALLPDGAAAPSPGARIRVTGRLTRPRDAGNPGERSIRDGLAERGITHFLVARTAPSLEVLDPAPALAPGAIVHRLRRALEARLRRIGDPPTVAFLSSLLLGRRDRLDESLADAFRRSGTAHFLAISGLHVGIVAAGVWFLLGLLPLPRAAARAGTAAAAVLYAAVTGFRPPAARAAVLVLLVVTGAALRRRARPIHVLAAAAIVLLAADPAALARPGFLLSFTAVLAIVRLARPIEDGLFGTRKLLAGFSVPRERPLVVRALERYLIRSVPVSLAAWLGTAPILLTAFGTLSLVVVPANLLVFPFVALLLPAGFLAAATGFALPSVILVRGVSAVVVALAAVPFAALTLPAPPVPVTIAYYALLALAGTRPVLGRVAVAALLAALAALAVSGPLLRARPAEPRATVLDVGHGQCVVVETPEGGVLVYDAGSNRPALFRRVLLPFLRERGALSVDALVLSHDDSDHTSGAAALLRNLPVKRFYPPGTLERGDVVRVPGLRADVLWPVDAADLSDNDSSAVLLVRAGRLRILLTGDIEERGIEGLTAGGRDLVVDTVVLPHHGRPEPRAADLATRVGAAVLVASDGPTSPLDPAWAGAIRTSEKGAITIYAGGRVETFR